MGNGATYTQIADLQLPADEKLICLGANNKSFAGSLDSAELIIMPRALSVAGMPAVYTRSKTRMTNRGITLV